MTRKIFGSSGIVRTPCTESNCFALPLKEQLHVSTCLLHVDLHTLNLQRAMHAVVHIVLCYQEFVCCSFGRATGFNFNNLGSSSSTSTVSLDYAMLQC